MATPTKIPTNGNDYLVFTAASEHIKGNGGNDTIKAGGGNDKVQGGDGNDLIYGEAGNDSLYGEAGNDVIYGGDGNDYIDDSSGNNKLYGETGADRIIINGNGNHWVDAGPGNDYVWAKTSTAADRTYYLGSGADKIDIFTTYWGDLSGKHGINPLGTVRLPDFNPNEGDVLSLVHTHDTKFQRGSTSFDNNTNTLTLSGFSGSGHGQYGKIIFPKGLTEAQIASHTLIDFDNYIGQYSDFG